MFNNSGNALEKAIEATKTVPTLYEFIQDNCFCAGGAVRDIVRGNTPKDYDLFFKTEESKDYFLANFSKRFVQTSIGNFNFKDIQFITIYTGSPDSIINRFDWNVNQTYYDFKTKEMDRRFNRGTDLILNLDAEKLLSAMIRLPYLLSKGFTISQDQFLFCLSYLSSRVNLKSVEDVLGQHEWMSSGGGLGADKSTWAITNANNEAKKRTGLYKALK